MEVNEIKIDRECVECGGTGLHVGIAEGIGAAIVCQICKGSGCEHVRIKYTPFTKRRSRRNTRRVFQVNPGIEISERGDGTKPRLEDFGGMPYSDWEKGEDFPPGSEMRKFTCPAWWYQSANYDKKPGWKECRHGGCFCYCKNFENKEECWKRWDEEYGGKS